MIEDIRELNKQTVTIFKSNSEFTVFKLEDGTPIIEQTWLGGSPAAKGAYVADGRVLRLGESSVISCSGLRGSGKSLTLAYLICKALAIGMTVFSNLNVRFCLRRYDGSMEKLSSLPLDWNALYKMDEGLSNGAVVIDELQYFGDSRKSGSVKNQILNSVIMQVRKRELDFYYSVKNLKWVDVRLRFETDFEFACEDAHRLYPAQARNKGEIIMWRFRELSGILTGHTWDERAEGDGNRGYLGSRHEQVYQFDAFPFWWVYDTKDVVSLEDAFTKVRLDLDERVISNKPQRQAEFIEVLTKNIEDLRAGGLHSMGCEDFARGISEQMGRVVTTREIGQYRNRLGFGKRKKHDGSSFYEFDSGEEKHES